MLYFTRHGQTNDNVKELYSGTRNVSINKTGKLQAQLIAEKLKNVKLDVIYCSPAKRAKQTLKHIIKNHKQTPIIFDNRIMERYHGKLEGKPVNAMAVGFEMWSADDNKDIPGLEKITDIYKRVKNFYDEIIPQNKGKNVLVISHGGIYRLTHAYFNGIPKNNDYSQMLLDNCEIATYEI